MARWACRTVSSSSRPARAGSRATSSRASCALMSTLIRDCWAPSWRSRATCRRTTAEASTIRRCAARLSAARIAAASRSRTASCAARRSEVSVNASTAPRPVSSAMGATHQSTGNSDPSRRANHSSRPCADSPLLIGVCIGQMARGYGEPSARRCTVSWLCRW